MEKQVEKELEKHAGEITRGESLPSPVKGIFLFLSIAGIGLAIFYLFNFSIQGKILSDYAYYFLITGIYSGCSFLVLPARKGARGIPWYDLGGAVLAFGICFYFFFKADEMIQVGWTHPSTFNFILGLILWLLILEGGRRTGGVIYLTVCFVLGLYPLISTYMPGVFWGYGLSFVGTVSSMVFTDSGLMGIPLKVLGEILIGFLLFAGFLLGSGAGDFFLKLALCLCGRFRGGPAKVAVIASGFFGSFSGSVIANVVGTGSWTIPAMKRMGYPPHYAGAIEACASTGGVLMPPVMGAVAFVMCTFLGISYSEVIVAAIIPAVLYYFGLLMQVDAFAARVGLKGLPKAEIPSLKKTLKEGWHFLAIFFFLIWGLLYMRWEELTPYYAVLLMFFLSFFRRETFMTPRRIIKILVQVGNLIAQTAAIILPLGFIISGLTITGVSGSFSAGMVYLGGENIYLTLLLGVFVCFLMGMVGMVTVAYIFLAVTLGPAVTKMGQFNLLAVHLFIMYYSMLAAITPPVAVGAFVGAAIAGADPMKTAFQSMRLGVVIYIIPFFFVFNPSLILQGPILETLYNVPFAFLGVVVIAAGMEGYLLGVGSLGFWTRLPLVLAGILITFPAWQPTIVGAVIFSITLSILLIKKNRQSILSSPG